MKELRLIYVKALMPIFFESSAKFRIVTKGRRLGMTLNTAQYIIERCVQERIKVLWGDTVNANIDRYVQRYFMPILKKIKLYKYNKVDKQLKLCNSVIDFRSADNPENWEGFGYDLVFLNEAGIILENRYLWENAVRPMLLDNPNSVAIIAGTPKGKNLFYELYLQALADTSGKWQAWQIDTFQNSFLQKEEIEEMIKEMPDQVVRQEIYGEFIDVSDNCVFNTELVLQAMSNNDNNLILDSATVWGVDIARQGTDFSVIAKRRYRYIEELDKFQLPDFMQIASYLNAEYVRAKAKPKRIYIDVTGLGGYGVVDRCREYDLPVYPCNFSDKSIDQQFLNKRAEMYFRLAEELKNGLRLPDDKRLKQALLNTQYKFNDKGQIQLIGKEKIKEHLGFSPDEADAVALTFYEPMGVESATVGGFKFNSNIDIPVARAGY